MNDENENVNNDSNDLDDKKQEITDRLPPKRDGLVSKAFGKLFGKKGKGGLISKIWNSKFFLKYKLIIIAVIVVIILIIAILVALNQISTETAISHRADSISALQIDESSSEEDQLALKLYEEYDSLIGFTNKHLDTMYQDLLDDKNTRTKFLIDTGKKEVGDDNDTYSILDRRPLYEHIQRTEKYNFNQIIWTEFSHNKDEKDIPTVKNEERGLLLPQDAENDKETYKKLLEMTAPYLLTNDIPLGMLTGSTLLSSSNSLGDAGKAEKFVYQIEKESMTKMKISKYDLQSRTVHTYYEEGKDYTYNQSIKIKKQSNGSYIVTDVTDGEPIKEENHRTEEARKEGTSDKYDNEIVWYVREAHTYDNNIINEFEYELYSQDDVESLSNFDTNQFISNDKIEKVVSGTKYKVNDIYDYNGSGADDESTGATHTVTNQYTERIADGRNYEKTWKDKVTPKKSEVKTFSHDDLVEYNSANNEEFKDIPTDKKLQDAEKVRNGTSKYKDYEKEDKTTRLYGMSMIDFLNSNPGIYEKYLNSSSAKYGEYMGIYRVSLKESYAQVKSILNELCKKLETEKKVPFVYGSSLGYETTNVGYSSGSSYMGGMALLKAYLRSREGHEGLADENGNEVSSLDNATYYIVGKVYVDKEKTKYTRTVGYGVDLDTSGYEPEIMAAMGRTTKFEIGDQIPIEIVDKCEEDEIKRAIDAVNAEFADVELTGYQVHALVSRYYNCGCAGWKWGEYSESGKTITESYKANWNEEKDDIFEEVYEEFKDTPEKVAAISAKADYENPFYTDYMKFPTNGGLLTTRRQSEWMVFSMGYYDTLQVFYSNSLTPGNINLMNSDGSVNKEACVELTNWYVDNLFSGNAHMRFPAGEMGGWNISVSPSMTSFMNYKDFPYMENGLQNYQCTWWARVRASLQAQLMDPDHFNGYIHTSGNGTDVAKNTAHAYGLEPNMDIYAVKPNSLVSWYGGDYYDEYGNLCGHICYCEAVDTVNNLLYVSHCGGGKGWYGITTYEMDKYADGKSYKSYRFNGSVAIEDIVNSEKYQGGNKW